MEVKQAIKKVVAIGAGATMVGATVLSAIAAADLSAYPAPFVKDGAYDAVIVVGDTAAAQDVVGAVDIGASLQYAMKKSTKVQACSGATATVANGVAIAKTGSYLNYNETLYNVRDTPMGADDLPTVLADGKYDESKGENSNKVGYTQKIYLINNDNSGKFVFAGDTTSGFDNDKDASDMIYFGKNSADFMYRYMLTFDQDVVFDNTSASTIVTDLKNSQIEMQGGKYTITDLKATGTTITEMTLMAGDTLLWLTQDQKITKTVKGVSHEIQVVDVTENADACGISVDGDVAWVDKGASETINGVQVGVTDAKAVHAQLQDQDICQVNVGSVELKIRGTTGKIQKDGSDVDNAYGYITQGGQGNKWQGLNLTFIPNDKIYMSAGDEYTDPVLQRWKFMFGGVGNADYEDMKMEVTSDDRAEFTFVNYEGKKVTVPFALNTTQSAGNPVISLGDGSYKLLTAGQNHTSNSGDLTGTMLWVVTSGHVAHVMKLDGLDTFNSKLSIKDVTYDKAYTDRAYTAATDTAIELGTVGSITLNVNGTRISYVAGPSSTTVFTKNEATIALNGGNTSNNALAIGVRVIEKDDADSTAMTAGAFNLTLSNVTGSATGTQKMQVSAPGFDNGLDTFITEANVKTGDNYVKVKNALHGTKVTYDNKDSKWVTIQHPKKDVIANVFIAPISAVVGELGGDIETVTLDPINLGAARLASEVKNVADDNMIVVGGPCANDVAAQVMGQSGDQCATGFADGKAIVKLYEQTNGKVAMLVAGSSAMDTRRATQVVAGYSKYASSLKGTEVVVSGTTLSDITVSAPQ